MLRGDVFYANLDPSQGAETQKTRPVVIVSNNAANRASSLVTVVPVTSNVARIYPFEVKLAASNTGLGKDSKAMAQQVRTLDKGRLAQRASGQVPLEVMLQVDAALRLHLAL
jgi:mRNA interferase MazF